MGRPSKKSKVDVEDNSMHIADDLINSIKEAVEHDYKSDKVAYYLDGSENTPADVERWISTGATMLDIAISNDKHGGWPSGRICELQGWEASGKSLLAAYALASTQRAGGIAVFIDTENAISRNYLRTIGVNINKLLYIQLEKVEEIFKTIETIIVKKRESDKSKPITIVVDSLTAATTKTEAESNYDKDGYSTSKSIILSKAYRKITNMIGKLDVTLIVTNQLRINPEVKFGDKATTSGGKSTGFHSSVRVRLKSMGKIKGNVNGLERVIGIKTKATVIKNRVGPPYAETDFDIFFTSGIDDYGSWLKTLLTYGVIKGTKKKYTFVDENTGEIYSFSSVEFVRLMNDNIELRNILYDVLCDKIIMPYSNITNFGIDDVIVELDEEQTVDSKIDFNED